MRALLILLAVSCLALTPVERRSVQLALDKVKQAQTDYSAAQQSTIEAWDYASKADQRAYETEAKIAPLQKMVDDSHENEQKLATANVKLQKFWDTGHKWFGLGAIMLGFGILTKNIFIAVAGIVVLLLVFWGLSFFFPILRPIFSIVSGFFRSMWNKIFKRRKP